MKKLLVCFLVCMMYVGFAAPAYKEVKLEIIDSTSLDADETTVNLDLGIGPVYNYTEDLKKVLNSTLQTPQVFSISSDNINCQVNSNGPFATSEIIPLGFRAYNIGSYTIGLKSLTNIDAACIIRLEDVQTGTFHHLQSGDYVFQVTAQELNTSRFKLHIAYPPVLSTVNADCSNQNGVIQGVQDSTIIWDACELFDSAGQQLATLSNFTGNFSFSGMPVGTYTLAFIYGSYIATQQVTLLGNQVSVTVGVGTLTIATGQTVQFSSWAVNTQHYEWNFGEGTIITEVANPQMIYYIPGVYNVVLMGSNDAGCIGYAYITITVTQSTDIAEGIAERTQVYTADGNIVINTGTALNATYTIANVSGQVVAQGKLYDTVSRIPLPDQAAGVYLVNIVSATGVLSKKVFAGK